MILVDTNVFVYAADRSFAEHARCHALVSRLRQQTVPWHTTWPILYELLNVVTHRRFGPRPWSLPEAWKFVEGLLASRSLKVLGASERHREVAGEVLGAVPSLRGAVLHDAHTAVLMREHGIGRILTRDTDFHRFPFLEVFDPMAGGYGPGWPPGGLGVGEPLPRRRRRRKSAAAPRGGRKSAKRKRKVRG